VKVLRCRSAQNDKIKHNLSNLRQPAATDTNAPSCRACASGEEERKNFHLKGFFIKFDVLGQHIMHRLHILYIRSRKFLIKMEKAKSEYN
jgi:hypothetical protein